MSLGRQVFEGSDACVTPVLTMEEAPGHPHSVARGSFVPDSASDDRDMQYTPAPAPVLSESPALRGPAGPYPQMGEHTVSLLQELGYSDQQIQELLIARVVCTSEKSIKGKL